MDLRKERSVLASKTKEGKPTPIEELGTFLSYDDNNQVKFQLRSFADPNSMIEIRVEKVCGLLRFYENGVLSASLDISDTLRAHKSPLADPVSVSPKFS